MAKTYSQDNVDYSKCFFTSGNKKVYGLKHFTIIKKLIKDLHNRNMTIGEEEIKKRIC